MDDHVNLTIVTYNRLECTKRCIASILERTRFPFVLTIIDNNSADGTRDYLERLAVDERCAKHINRVVFLETNMGVSPAYNLGWALSDAPYYMKIDNDVEFLRDDWLPSLVQVARENRDAAMVGFGKNSSGFKLKGRDDVYYQGHAGGCALIRRDAHERLGFWNEDYGLYGEEDSDFGLRARLAGYCNLTLHDEEAPYIRYVDELDGNYQDYRSWKTRERKGNLNEMFAFNDTLFKCGFRELYVGRKYIPRPNGENFTFVPDRKYIQQLESLKKKYMPLLEKIRNSQEYEEIQKLFNVFY